MSAKDWGDLAVDQLLEHIARLQKDNERLRTLLNQNGIADDRGRIVVDDQLYELQPGERYTPPSEPESAEIIQFPTPPPQGGGDQ